PDKYNIYALDFPGFGQSDTPKNNFYLKDYADTVESFIKKNNLENIIIIGHSFGGSIGIKIAADNPKYLKKLALVDSAGIRKNSKINIKKIIAKILKPIFKLSFLKSTRVKIYQAMGAEDYLATPQLQKTFVNIVAEDLTVLLPKIKVPVLLVWGENDKDTPIEHARVMEREIPNAKLIIFEGAGHFSFLDKEDEFINNLQKFLE
ncbi:MAG: alpha/beta hydrolase, partial [Patescibacteria group bacterium]